jgi:hypothetical protein
MQLRGTQNAEIHVLLGLSPFCNSLRLWYLGLVLKRNTTALCIILAYTVDEYTSFVRELAPSSQPEAWL